MISILIFITVFALATDLSERSVRAGGWSEFEGDFNSKWKEALSTGVISVDGVSAEDLTQLGEPVKATSQVVAGTNYKFEFADGTEITVLEQLWMDPKMQITRIESQAAKSFPVEICENSPQQLCRMLCPKQQFCPDENQCAMRQGPCCHFTCIDRSDVVKTGLSKEGESCEGWDETSAKPFPICEEGLVCKDAGKVSIPGAGNVCMQELGGSSCSLEDGSTVPSGWKGPGIGDNYCNRCWCNDGAFMCTLKGCLPRGATLDVFAQPELTTWSLKGAWDMSLVQKYLEEFTEIFADTLRVDKAAVQSVVIRPMGTDTEMKVSAFLTPAQKKYVDSPAFESLLRENIKSTADDLAKGMGYDIRSGSFILQGPWDVNAVEGSSFELQRQFALALGIPMNLVDVEITEDDFLTKIDFTAKSEGSKLTPLNNPLLFQQTLEKQIKQTNPALATVLALTDQPAAPIPMQKTDNPSVCPADMPDMNTPCTDAARCEYGQECCCGKCFASQVFQCDANAGLWVTFYTDACFAPSCEGNLPGIATVKMDSPDTPDKPDKIDAPEVQGLLDSPDTPDKHDSMYAPEMQGFVDSADTPDKHDSIYAPNMPGFVADSLDTPDKHDSMNVPDVRGFAKMDSPDTPDKPDQSMQFPDSPGLVLESGLESASSSKSSSLLIFVVFLGLTFGFAAAKCLNRSKMQNKDVYTDLAANV